jgi:hypothetical protein
VPEGLGNHQLLGAFEKGADGHGDDPFARPRSMLVAAIIRQSDCIVLVLPSGSNVPSWSVRRSLAWIGRLSVPISSRKSVPPSP